MKAANGGVVGLFSLEMSSGAARHPHHLEQTEIPSSRSAREISEADFEKLVACSQMMQKLPLYTTSGRHLDRAARQRARRLKRQRGLDLIVIDYIQLMIRLVEAGRREPRAGGDRDHHRAQGGPRSSAPIIALSQLSRQVESRDDKRPQLSTCAVGLDRTGRRRRAVHLPRGILLKNKEPKPGTEEYIKWEAAMNDARGKAEVIVAKQRHGPTGMVPLGFQGEFTRFFGPRGGQPPAGTVRVE